MKDNPCTAAKFLENIAYIIERTNELMDNTVDDSMDILHLTSFKMGVENQIRKYRRLHSPQDGAELAVNEANAIAQRIKEGE